MTRLLFIVGLFLASAGFAAAQDAGSPYLPNIPAASGDPHPEGNEYMRRNHMNMMLHERDRTMYDGVRGEPASLKGCFTCHTVKDETGTPVTYQSEQHFCRTCHDYAAVKVDCFMCHRSTPDGFDEPAPHAFNENRGEDVLRLARAYLDAPKTKTLKGAETSR